MSGALDVIALRGLSVKATHGVLPEERVLPQLFVIDLSLGVDTADACRSDDIRETVSYAEVAQLVNSIVTGPAVHLIETLAHKIADALMAMDKVRAVEVTVHKPQAPIPHHFEDVSVTVSAGDWDLVDGITEPDTQPAPEPELEPEPEGEAPAEPAPFVPPVFAAPAPPAPPAPSAPVAQASPAEDAAPAPAPAAAPAYPMYVPTPAQVVLALGGNIGDAPTTLATAVKTLMADSRLEIVKVSPLLRTKAVLAPGQVPQDDYWNAIVIISTELQPHEVLELARSLENAAGRQRTEHWGARTLDVDIIDYEGVQINDAELTLPHPRARSRAFVLAPWSYLEPGAMLGGENVSDLLNATTDREGIIDAVAEWLNEPHTVIAESNTLLAIGAPTQVHLGEDAAPAAPQTQAAAPAAPAPVPAAPTFVMPTPAQAAAPAPAPTPASAPAPQVVPPVTPAAQPVAAAPAPAPAAPVFAPVTQPVAPAPAATPQPTPQVAQPAPAAPQYDAAVPAAAPQPATSGEATADLLYQRLKEKLAANAAAAGTATAAPATPVFPEASFDQVTAADPQDLPKRKRRPGLFRKNNEDAIEAEVPGDAQSELQAALSRVAAREASNPPSPEVTVTPRSARRLPDWDFKGRVARIIDDASLDEPTTPGGYTLSRSVVDPGLPADASRGIQTESDPTRTGLLRNMVMRPSATGPMNVTQGRDGV